ncbi:MAG: SLBB domain-containing protein [Bacteroidales bacterium]|nr:SLBB domain-containing protein [Bacteroidales bacterium]
MNKKIILLVVAALALAVPSAFAQMSDDQIITYIAQGVSAGKTERQIGAELMAKGVTTTQLKRLFKEYKSGDVSTSGVQVKTNKLETVRPERKAADTEAPDSKTDADVASKTDRTKSKTKEAGADDEDEKELDEKLYDETGNKIIYGHNVFTTSSLSFEPNQNAATPEDYILGPGDEVVIDIWGASEATIRQIITPEGRIIVSQVGPIQLAGLTVKQATSKIRSSLSRTAFSSLANSSSKLSVTLGNARTVQVNILGEVKVPGTYRLSSFSTVFNALYRAGGVTETGSLRCVKLVRGGEMFAEVDVYEYLFNGFSEKNLPVKEGDVLIVPAYSELVSVSGGVKRPMFYELKEGESVSQLLGYAGGFAGGAFRGSVNVERNDGRTNHIFTVNEAEFGSFALADGDAVSVSVSEVDIFSNKVEVSGAVYRPGVFQLGGDLATVGQLIAHAGGLLEDAFTGRAQIVRERPDRSLEIVPVPLKGIVEGNAKDILLQRNDRLVIFNVNEIEEKGDFHITGYVVNPGYYQYAAHTSVEDLILLAGGLAEGASSAKVDIARRIVDPTSTSAQDTLAVIFSVAIKNGLVEDGAGAFELEPYDVVSVRRSPTYSEQRNVTISGEVTFPGQYTLVTNSERVSELVHRAGGPTPKGNVHGAMLKRKINQYERNVRTTMARIIAQNASTKDSIDVNKVKVSEIYTVGLELDKALKNPGSDYDIVLRDGDELIIPEETSTVRVQGEVLYPNTVHFITGKPIRYYVKQAGGFSNQARRAKTYVVYMNGTVSAGLGSVAEPGCEIVVPSRAAKDKLTTGEWLAIGTSAASVTTMIATIVSLFKK